MRISGRVAIVTGAASGIGRVLALRLARAGARGVVVIDADGAGAEAVAAEIGSWSAPAPGGASRRGRWRAPATRCWCSSQPPCPCPSQGGTSGQPQAFGMPLLSTLQLPVSVQSVSSGQRHPQAVPPPPPPPPVQVLFGPHYNPAAQPPPAQATGKPAGQHMSFSPQVWPVGQHPVGQVTEKAYHAARAVSNTSAVPLDPARRGGEHAPTRPNGLARLS